MAIDKKYFNTFVLIFAIAGALIIAVATFWFSNTQQNEFRSEILANDSLATQNVVDRLSGDTLGLQDPQQYTILFFWNGWLDASLKSGEQIQDLIQKQQIPARVLVAPMHTPMDSVETHWLINNPKITIIDGNRMFKELHVPGVPASIWINQKGKVVYAQIGYLDPQKALQQLER